MEQGRQQEITKALDELIQSRKGVETADQLFRDFLVENPQPVPPKTFESVEALASYLERKEKFDKGYATQENQSNNFDKRYEEAIERVQRFLPIDTRMIYEYRGDRYLIWNRIPISNRSFGGAAKGEPGFVVKKIEEDSAEGG